MSPTNIFTLESLIETHDMPFMVIDDSLTIVAVNDAWERQFGVSKQEQIGRPCCNDNQDCRHSRFFKNLEPYAGVYAEGAPVLADHCACRFSGYPLNDAEGRTFIGESITFVQQSRLNETYAQMEGISPSFLKLQAQLLQAAKSSVPVLLNGETGTGKEVAAAFIHAHSGEVGDFVVVDCTLLTENLCESELFGHEKGAFTHAVNSKKGLFELAHNGTLLLDEVGELPLSQQPKLLRALESGQFRRVGGTKPLSSKVRVISATHKNLGDMVKAGTFREDLFYRLSVLSIDIPPLRERKQDIPLLAEYLLRQEGHAHFFTPLAIAKLVGHRWPGNIRELKNCVQLAAALAQHNQIDKQEIHILRRRARSVASEAYDWPALTSTSAVQSKQLERELIAQLLVKHKGNRKQVAAEMQISERTLYRKLERYQLS